MRRAQAAAAVLALLGAAACDPKSASEPDPPQVRDDKRPGYAGGAPSTALVKRAASEARAPSGPAEDPGRCLFDAQCLRGGAGVPSAGDAWGPKPPVRFTAATARLPSDLNLGAPPPPSAPATLWQRFSAVMSQYARGARPEVDEVVKQAKARGVDPAFALAIGMQESALGAANRPSAAGALGVMQVMPKTACGEFGVCDRSSVASTPTNVAMGVEYLKRYSSTPLNSVNPFDPLDASRMACAAAKYNAGPGNVGKFGCSPPFAETRQYVANVIEYAKMFRRSLTG